MRNAVKALFVDRQARETPVHAERKVAAAKPARPQKPRYKVDLAAQQAECELNYRRLCQLLPDLADTQAWQFEMGSGATHSRLHISVVERAPYTVTLQLTQRLLAASATPLGAPQLTVRLYHDAQMAEVVAWEAHRQWQPRYEYPNRQMYHSDEKAQVNGFLSDWLALCHAQGRSAVAMEDLGISPKQ